ncbi:uncharacterized protein LOC142639858 [Castanea sativa]|uniref:uncharacterized protein LOC142639858 n=1 Tax=Castanea sativa TaxID=21020 RepID=UPI003F6548E6
MDEKSVGMISLKESLSWKVYMDGATNQRGFGAGLVKISPDKIVIEKSLRMGFSAMNNEAEYEALLIGMTMVQKIGGKNVEMFLDSRNRNTHADSLATLATSSARSLSWVILVEDLYMPTKKNVDVVHVHQIKVGPSWIDPVVLYLKENILLEEKSKAEKVCRKAPWFWLSKDQKLYKRSFSGPYLLCMNLKVTKLLLEELHEGICGSHTWGRSLSRRALTQGYRWPNMQKEALEYVKKCDQCQSLIVRPIEDIAAIWVLQIDIGTLAYPQGNGQAKAVNKVIVNEFKKRLDDAKGRWVEELPRVLWTYRTTPRRSTGETPFSMTYGAEAVIPLETGFPTLRSSSFSPSINNGLLEKSLDLVEERRENAMV